MVGDTALLGGLSYIAIGREIALGTYTTCQALLPALSTSLKTNKDNKILENIARSRTYSQRTGQMKRVGGEIGFYFQPQLDACAFLLQNAFIGTITSATATGETVGGGAMDHTINVGETYQSYTSLCINERKGDTTAGKVWQYHGVRVAEMNFQAELNEALKCSVNLVGLDSTQVANNVQTTTMQTLTSVLNFADGRVSVEGSPGSLTSTSFWHVQSVEWGINNNLKTDAASGRIGSDVLAVIPPGMAAFPLRMKMRFNTTTAYDAMIAATKLSVQLDFQGPTMPGSAIRQKLRFNFPSVYVHDGGDPSIGGPNEILSSQVEFHVLQQDDTTAGYAVQAILTNQKSSYA